MSKTYSEVDKYIDEFNLHITTARSTETIVGI